MNFEQFDLKKRLSPKRLEQFAECLIKLSDQIGIKVSSRGWGYQREQERLIDKNQFDKVEAAIIPFPRVAEKLITDAFEKYLGPDAPKRFRKKRDEADEEYAEVLDTCGVDLQEVEDAIRKLNGEEED